MPGPVTCSRASRASLPGHYLHFKLGQRHAGAGDRADDLLADRLPRPRAGRLRRRREEGRRRVRGGAATQAVQRGCGPTCRSCRTCPAASIRASSWRWRTRPSAGRSRRSPSPITEQGAEREDRGAGASPGTSAASRSWSTCGHDELRAGYPELIARRRVPGGRHVVPRRCCTWPGRSTQHGYKVALTGEGADEWLAGYPWFKIHKLRRLARRDPRAAARLRGCAGCSCRLTGAADVPVLGRTAARRQPSAGTTAGSTSTA